MSVVSEYSEDHLPTQVQNMLGVSLLNPIARFKTPGWRYLGQTDIPCKECKNLYYVFRKPYETTKGKYEYWGIVCTGCRSISGLEPFRSKEIDEFQAWMIGLDESPNVKPHLIPNEGSYLEELKSKLFSKSLHDIWKELCIDYPKRIVIIQRGAFFESYDDHAEFLNDLFNLSFQKEAKRLIVGFPVSKKNSYIKEIEFLGYAIVVVEEVGWNGKSKFRGITHITGNPQATTTVLDIKVKLSAEDAKKKADKTDALIKAIQEVKSRAGTDVVLVQYGYMFNAFEHDAELLSKKLGLKLFNRYGFLTVGFPVISKEIYFDKIRLSNLSFCIYDRKSQTYDILVNPSQDNPQTNLGKPHQSSRTISIKDNNSSLMQHALNHAKNGFYVFPLVPMSKKPLISDWQKKATTNALQIEAWWTDEPNANIGIACEVSNLIVLDLDYPKNGEIPTKWDELGIRNGEEMLSYICKTKAKELPIDTYTVSTPNSGKHLYFHDNAMPVKQGTEINGWWKIDLRSKGGYIVGEGSRIIAQATGAVKGYFAKESVSELKPFPEWLRDELEMSSSQNYTPKMGIKNEFKKSKTINTDVAKEILFARCQEMRSTPEGKRNQQLLRHSCYLGKLVGLNFISESEVMLSLLDAAIQSGLSRAESIRTIQNGLNYGIRVLATNH